MRRPYSWPLAVFALAAVGLCIWAWHLGGEGGLVASAFAFSPGDGNENGNENGNQNGNENGNDNGDCNGNQNGNDNGNDNVPAEITVIRNSSAACDDMGVEIALQVCNDGTTDLSDVSLTETLPPGMTFVEGSIAGTDANGNPIGVGPCVADEPGGECPCEGGVTFLRMRYNGPNGAHVTVQAKHTVIFDQILNDGDIFELHGSRDDGRFQKNNLIFTVDGADTVIHVSCSQPIGVGFVFGPFAVEAFASRRAGLFDGPCLPPPPACPCDGGVTSLTLRFNGDAGTLVTVDDKDTTIFSQILNDGDIFTVNGSRADGRFQKQNLVLSANDEDTTIHVSCSQPIGVGYVFGPFTVEAFTSRNAGTFDLPCDGSESGDDDGDDHQNACRGETVSICLDNPIPPGECVTITYVVVFEDVLCTQGQTSAQVPHPDCPDRMIHVETTSEGCLGDLLNDMLACVCEPTGACCLFDGTCAPDQTAAACAGFGGVYQGDGSGCDPNLCPVPPTGACCLGDGTCVPDQAADTCVAFGGVYQGDASGCVPNLCPVPPTGACCLGDGVCVPDQAAGACAAFGGVYQGDGSICTPNPCPIPTGACCFGDGVCLEDTPDACFAAGGQYAGDGSTCTPNPCCQPGGDPFDIEAFCNLAPNECDPFVIQDCIFSFEDSIFNLLFDAEDQFMLGRCEVCCPPADIFCDCLVPE